MDLITLLEDCWIDFDADESDDDNGKIRVVTTLI